MTARVLVVDDIQSKPQAASDEAQRRALTQDEA
jgi:hypothetical protein